MMRDRYTAFVLGTALLFTLGASAQQSGGAAASSPAARFEEANRLMEEKLFNQAVVIWQEQVAAQPQHSNLNWKTGYAYMQSYNQKNKALPFLEVAAANRKSSYGGLTGSGYDPFDAREVNAPPEVEYWLARAYHLDSQFDKADEHYSKFLGLVPEKNDLAFAAKRGLEQTANARVLIADPKPYRISNVGPVINNDHPDFSPVLSVDGNALFYTTRRVHTDSSNAGVIDLVAGLPYENIYVSYKDRQGNWQAPEVLNINAPAGHMATVNVAADGQTLLIYRDDGGDGNLYESKLVGELWSEPVLMGSDINTKSWETHGALSADGNTFYFISDRKGGFGGRDIYRVVRLPNGEWSKAQNMGDVLNTPHDEDGVFIHPNGRNMYFASKGHNSMGGFDIFTSELQEDGTWTTPQNIGYPLNTVDDDVFFVTTADGRRGYFSSDKDGGYGEKDIYFVDFPEEMEMDGLTVLKGFIIPPSGESLPPTTVLYVTDKSTGEVRAYKPRQRDGVYVAILPPCREYNLDYRVNDITIHSEDIFVECESAYQEINKEVYLNPVSLAGPASILDLPKGSPPGNKEEGVPGDHADSSVPPVIGGGALPAGKDPSKPVTDGQRKDPSKPLTDAQRKEQDQRHVAPDGTYKGEFIKYYAYNEKDISQEEADWKRFTDVVMELLEKNGSVRVVIEASASRVPTKTFGTNEKLSTSRMEDARARLLEAVRAKGLDPNKLLLESVSHRVQGPRYQGDFKNTEKYGKFQYVKLKVR